MVLTNFSIDGECTSTTFSERRGWLLRAFAALLMGDAVLQKPYRGLSPLVFDLI